MVATPDESVTYALDLDDVDAARSAIIGTYRSARTFVRLGIFWLLLGSATIVFGFWPYHRHGFQFNAYVLGPLYILNGINLLVGTKSRFLVGRSLRAGCPSALAWDERGICSTIGTRSPKAIPWATISRFESNAAVILLYRVIGPTIVVPRRAFSDGGAAFLRYVDGKKVGKRLLVRTPPQAPYRPQKLSDFFPW